MKQHWCDEEVARWEFEEDLLFTARMHEVMEEIEEYNNGTISE